MLRVILISLVSLVLVWFFAQKLGLGPGQAEDFLLLAQMNDEDGQAYLAQNRTRAGVVELADGLQLEILELGEGPVPEYEDWISVHYKGWHLDGRLFESTYRLGIPGNVPLKRTIPAWQRVLVEVPVGTRLRLVTPPELAYGQRGAGRIGPNETLIFEVELLAIYEPPQAIERDELQRPVPGLR